MQSPLFVVCMLSLISCSYGNPISNNTEVADAADNLAVALNTFVNAKGDELMEEVNENVGEIKDEIEGQSAHLQMLENEIQAIAETGSIAGCRGVLHLGYCYFLVNQRYSIQSAQLSCERSDGKLASFSDEAAIDIVHDYVIHTDHITDKSTIFVWTNMTTNDENPILEGSDNWLPGFPVSNSAENVMWQIMSDDFFLYHDGFLNAPSEATAYPLCRKTVIPDVDECADANGTALCMNNGVCVNTPASYECECTEGWSGDVCQIDVDECELLTYVCDDNASCQNNNGSYSCLCNSGWIGDGYSCEDIDECNINNHTCDDSAMCENNNGSYSCICNEGYTGDGFTCEDSCTMEVGYCLKTNGEDQNDGVVELTNADGSKISDQNTCLQKCKSHAGATGCEFVWDNDEWSGCYAHTQEISGGNDADLHYCWVFSKCDANECTDGSHSCDENASCGNTVGSYTCTCNSGYEGDGYTCDNGCDGKAYDGKCYVFQGDQQRNYQQSNNHCNSVSGRHLAYINHWPIQNAIMGYLRDLAPHDNLYVWVGGSYPVSQYPTKTVQWNDGTWTTIPDNHWYPGYPNNNVGWSRLLIQVRTDTSNAGQGLFNYDPNYSSLAYAICEFDL